jgi:hypothetical protein
MRTSHDGAEEEGTKEPWTRLHTAITGCDFEDSGAGMAIP